MIESTLSNRLKGQATNVSNRVYPNVAPSGVDRPYLVYRLVSPGRDYTHAGFSDLSESRFQVSVFADNYGSAKNTAKQVKDGLEGWKTSEVLATFLAGEMDLYEDDTKIHHIPLDFWIWHKEEDEE